MTSQKPLSAEIEARLRPIKLLALDGDGVLTDGALVYDHHGDDQHVFSVRDGHGLFLLHRHVKDLKLALVSGRHSLSMARRVKELNFDFVLQGVQSKAAMLRELCLQCDIDLGEVCYVGDDINDIGALRISGLSVAVSDAVMEAKNHAQWITTAPGGKGAVREICEAILKAKGLWPEVLRRFEDEALD